MDPDTREAMEAAGKAEGVAKGLLVCGIGDCGYEHPSPQGILDHHWKQHGIASRTIGGPNGLRSDCPLHSPGKCLCAAGEPNPAADYVKIAAAIGQVVVEKQAAYGDSFGKSGAVLRVLYPNGISLKQLDDALTIVRVVDKLFRIATDKDAFGESPWKDIVGYGLLAVARSKAGAR